VTYIKETVMSLYSDIGGEAAVDAAVDVFYGKVLNDPSVNYFFDGLEMTRQKAMLKHFLTFAFGGHPEYTGRSMRAAHARQVQQGMNEQHFDAIVGHLGATLTELGVPGEHIQSAASIAMSVKDDVLNR
jgi:hemoglobin